MAEYWLISAPGDKTMQQTWETMNNVTSKQNNLCVNYKFHIPDLKVGTLDQLVGLSDDLGKLDGYVESITRKVATYLGEVLEDQRDKLQENLLANNSPGPPDYDSPEESHSSDLGTTTAYSQHNHNLNNNHSSANLNHSNNNNNHIHGGHHAVASDNKHEQYGSRQGSLSSERDCDSCACSGGNNSGGNGGGSETESPNEPYTQTADNDVFDWWFHRNRSSKKSRSRSSSQLFYNGTNSTYRSSPVSSCCGSSQGRSSPEVDLDGETIGEPPHMPLSPADLPSYITRFQWDMAKYPIKQSLRNIADIISKQVGQIDADLKTKSAAYNNLKGNLQNLEKKQTGSLLTRNLADLVKKEHFILDSEYLTTLLVIVPKANVNDWTANYEKITDMIVPRSSQLITQDADYALFNVTLFKKVVEEFKLHAREKKFVVRDFTYNEEELAAGKSEITKLVTDKKKQFGPLVRWLKVNFSETFCAWIHVKALRVFVESVLRYGLPVNFQAILIHPNKKSVKRLRDVLNQLYSHLDGSASAPSNNADNVDIPGLGFGQSEYYPYVHYKLNIDMVESKIN
ncbi:V-type proton ATPase subunit C isoform X1 [Sitodiplosis mosellana]|uniref:V-type proton ATPase subunit C isoform X1 n=1 Tax=Sitodiplosis mosellana TaxID=263140 RepID=UPI002444AFCC|nr:V-type proton ATPase subunit C isoform X1 [Sitodiplosis mosellana]XP_055319371.1 V-type proton ATPase subunit C isoform X1 [Sitodiplosis mosellana]